MDRRTFSALWSVGVLLAGPLHAQPRHKVFRIGLLLAASEPTPEGLSHRETFRASLSALGWTDRNLVVESRWGGSNPQRLRELAAELHSLPVVLIVTTGTISIRAAREGAPGLPIVMVYAGDPVGAGFVRSLARPGGDLTGTSAAGEEVLAKQVELLAAAVPELRRISVLMNPANPANAFFHEAMSSRARTLGLQLERIDAATEGELEAAVARAKGGGLVVLGDPLFGRYHPRIIELAFRSRIPSMFGGRHFVVAGGLMSYLSSTVWHWQTAAKVVDKILKGAKPADIPVEQPNEYELVVNLKTARLLGLTIAKSVLLRANELIE